MNYLSDKKPSYRKFWGIIILSFFVLSNSLMAQEEIKLYSKGPKESNELGKDEKFIDKDFLRDVSEARMYAYIVPKEKSSGAAVLICPGGGYGGLSTIKEGKEYAEYLNELGISAFVLYYRMPNGHWNIPLADAQTAMEKIRKRAKEWNLDKNKIGVSGFSAGGHLASTLGTHFTPKNRPDFMILIYPVITMKTLTHGGSRNSLLGKNPPEELIENFSNETQVKNNTPPTFLVHSKDDKTVPIENSQLFYEALKEKNIPAELHVFEKGGHGYGLRKTGHDSEVWPEYLKKWLETNNLTKK